MENNKYAFPDDRKRRGKRWRLPPADGLKDIKEIPSFLPSFDVQDLESLEGIHRSEDITTNEGVLGKSPECSPQQGDKTTADSIASVSSGHDDN